ncbi:MAG: hypothetical protein EA385_08565 [Salinarimonadaceae bacterium]|nr:MAG: hypothetical protein EA385_08565 [Salinarimonadaceae bacterium]
MAYALTYPNAPAADADVAQTQIVAPAVAAPAQRPSFFTRLLDAVQRSQMARAERELSIYAPNLYAQMKAEGGFARVALSDPENLAFVK